MHTWDTETITVGPPTNGTAEPAAKKRTAKKAEKAERAARAEMRVAEAEAWAAESAARAAEAQQLVAALRQAIADAARARREIEETCAAVRALAHECTTHLQDVRARREDVEEAQREALTSLRAVEDDLVDEADDLVTAFVAHLDDLRAASRREWTRTTVEAAQRVDLAIEEAETHARAALHRSFDGIGRLLAAAEEQAADSMRALEAANAASAAAEADRFAPAFLAAGAPGAPVASVAADGVQVLEDDEPVEWRAFSASTTTADDAPPIDIGRAVAFDPAPVFDPAPAFDPTPAFDPDFGFGAATPPEPDFGFAAPSPSETPMDAFEVELDAELDLELGTEFGAAFGRDFDTAFTAEVDDILDGADAGDFAPPPTRNGQVLSGAGADVAGGFGDHDASPGGAFVVTTRAVGLLLAVEELTERGAEHVRIEARRRVKDGMLLTALRLAVRDHEGWWDIRELPARSRSVDTMSVVVEVGELVEVVAGIVRFDKESELDITVDGGVTVAGRRLDALRGDLVPVPPDPGGPVTPVNLGAARGDSLVVPIAGGWAVVPPVLMAHLRAGSFTDVALADSGDVPVLRARSADPADPDAAQCVAVLHRSADDDPNVDRRTTAASAVTHLLAALAPDTPAEDLERMLKVGVPYVRRRAAAHPNMPSALVQAIVQNDDDAMRAAAAANPTIPVAAAQAAVTDPVAAVRAALGANPVVPEALLARLSFDPVAHVRANVAGNPSASAEVLAQLVADEAPEVRATVAARTDVDLALLRALGDDVDPFVCAIVAANPRTEPDVLEHLVSVAPVEALSNPSAPEALLSAAALLDNPELRLAVATNPATPAAVLKRLARDRDESVRTAVAARGGN